MNTPTLKRLLEDWDAKDSVVATVSAAGPWLALQSITAVGFTTGGITAGEYFMRWVALD